MRWMWLMIGLMTIASGCTMFGPPGNTGNVNFNILSLTPYHCEGDHVPIHCDIGNQTTDTPAGRVYANYSIGGQAIGSPYPVTAPSAITVQIAYVGPVGNEEAMVTVAVDDVGGVKWTSPTNVTKELATGDTETVSFAFEPSPGWPNDDLIFPRLPLGVEIDGEERWTASHLIFVMAVPK